jgi:hypothetical protein
MRHTSKRRPQRLDILDYAKIRLDHYGTARPAPDLGARQQLRGYVIFALEYGAYAGQPFGSISYNMNGRQNRSRYRLISFSR